MHEINLHHKLPTDRRPDALRRTRLANLVGQLRLPWHDAAALLRDVAAELDGRAQRTA